MGEAHTFAVVPIDQSKATRFTAYMETLPAEQRGALLLGLWANAVLTLALQGAQLVLVVLAFRRAKCSRHPIEAALDVAWSHSTAAVISTTAVHRVARQYFLRLLDRRISRGVRIAV